MRCQVLEFKCIFLEGAIHHIDFGLILFSFHFLWHSFRLSLFHNTLPVYYGSSELSFLGNLVQLFIMNWIMVVMFSLFVG